MAPAQMVLPMERRNGASSRRHAHDPPAPELAPAPVAPSSSVVVVEAGLWVRRVTTLAVVLVAAVAAVASYEHMRALAVLAGEGWRSWLLPVSVDGLAVAASMTMLVRRRAGLPAGGLAWVGVAARAGGVAGGQRGGRRPDCGRAAGGGVAAGGVAVGLRAVAAAARSPGAGG